jgi:hypothetical protein
MRLVVFGDSNSYGTGLPDCAPGNIEGNPSKLAWPTLLADMLQLELINLTMAGSSNSHMLWTLRNTDIYLDDIVIVQWSWTGRDTLFNNKPHIVRPNEQSPINDQYYKLHTMDDIQTRNLQTIEHAVLWLEHKCIKWLMVAVDEQDPGLPFGPGHLISMALYPPPAYLVKDLGSDLMHSGVNTQAYWAATLHKLINSQAWNKPNLRQSLPLKLRG